MPCGWGCPSKKTSTAHNQFAPCPYRTAGWSLSARQNETPDASFPAWLPSKLGFTPGGRKPQVRSLRGSSSLQMIPSQMRQVQRFIGLKQHPIHVGHCLSVFWWLFSTEAKKRKGADLLLFIFVWFNFCSFFVRASKMSYFTAFSRENDAFYTSPSTSPASFFNILRMSDQHP